MSKPPPPLPTVCEIGPCPTIIQIVGRPGTGSLPSTIASPDHPFVMMIICAKLFLNPTMHKKVMGRTRTGFTEVYAQSLSADCDLDI